MLRYKVKDFQCEVIKESLFSGNFLSHDVNIYNNYICVGVISFIVQICLYRRMLCCGIACILVLQQETCSQHDPVLS